MRIEHDVRLTAAEISFLWGTYLGDSLAICMNTYFLQHIQDQNIRTLFEDSLEVGRQHVETIREIFTEEQIPIPHGFTDDDVNLKAKRLYSDIFCLNYVKHINKAGLATYAAILPNIFREDVRSFVLKCLNDATEMENKTTLVLLEKGLAVRPPYIPYPTEVDFIHKQSFLLEFLGRRQLEGTEVTNLFSNALNNNFGACMGVGFAQVADSKEVRDYISRGNDIAQKHWKVFNDYLENYSFNLPVPLSSGQDVTDSTESPFSDKLIMFHFSLMNTIGVVNYGGSISTSMRSDLTVDYSRLLMEVMKYAEDGMNIQINNSWLEQPPMASHKGKG